MTPPAHDCAAFTATWQAVLDGAAPAVRLTDAADCPVCRPAAAFAAGIQTTPFPAVRPQADFASSVVAAVVRDRRQRRVRRAGMFAGLAAGVLVAAGLAVRPAGPGGRDTAAVPPLLPPAVVVNRTPRPQRVTDMMADAGASLAALTRRAADAAPAVPSFAAADVPATAATPTDLARLPAAARSGLSPLTDGARRAVNVFLRDAGLGGAS